MKLEHIYIERETRRALKSVEEEFEMSGLSSGVYGDYAAKVAAKMVGFMLDSTVNELSDDGISSIRKSIEGAAE